MKLDNSPNKEKLATVNEQLDTGMQSILSAEEYELYKKN